MELGHWVTGSFGSSFTSGSPGHHFDPVWDPSISGFRKMPKMQNVLLKCWNDKSHCQVSVVGLKSLDHAMDCFFCLWLLKILWPENTYSHISRHLEFIIEQGHRVDWFSGSLDSRVTGSLGHKMWPSSISAICVRPRHVMLYRYRQKPIGNESVPIQLARCWFPGLAISNAKI